MPLNPAHRRYYGREWRALKLELIKQAGGHICSRCGIELSQGINGAHQDHDPRNPASVALMCPACHARNDARHRIAIMRRRKADATGQLWLSVEFEWAPFASWEIPPAIYDLMRQLPLFHDPRVS